MDSWKKFTWRAYFANFVTKLATVTRLAYTRVPLTGLGFLANTLIHTLIVGTHVTRTQVVFVYGIFHQVVRATFRFKDTNTTWTIVLHLSLFVYMARLNGLSVSGLTDESGLETDIFVY